MIRHLSVEGGEEKHEQLSKGRSEGQIENPRDPSSQAQRSGTELYVTSEDGYTVRIYPMQVWDQVEERLERLCSHNRNNQKLLVRAKYFGRTVTMDKQGRVLIPIVLRSTAQMKGAVDIFDYLNYLEVWNHSQFLKDLKSSPITAQDERTLNKLSLTSRLPWHKEEGHVHGTESRFRIRRRARPDSRGHLSRISNT